MGRRTAVRPDRTVSPEVRRVERQDGDPRHLQRHRPRHRRGRPHPRRRTRRPAGRHAARRDVGRGGRRRARGHPLRRPARRRVRRLRGVGRAGAARERRRPGVLRPAPRGPGGRRDDRGLPRVPDRRDRLPERQERPAAGGVGCRCRPSRLLHRGGTAVLGLGAVDARGQPRGAGRPDPVEHLRRRARRGAGRACGVREPHRLRAGAGRGARVVRRPARLRQPDVRDAGRLVHHREGARGRQHPGNRPWPRGRAEPGADRVGAGGAVSREIAVVGSPEFTTGFRLAGVRRCENVPDDQKPDDLDGAVERVLDDDSVGIVVMHDDDTDHLSRRVRERVETSIEPVVVTLGATGAGGLRDQIKRAIGIDLMNEENDTDT